MPQVAHFEQFRKIYKNQHFPQYQRLYYVTRNYIYTFIQHPHFSSLTPSANHLQINQRILSRQKSNGH